MRGGGGEGLVIAFFFMSWVGENYRVRWEKGGGGGEGWLSFLCVIVRLEKVGEGGGGEGRGGRGWLSFFYALGWRRLLSEVERGRGGGGGSWLSFLCTGLEKTE